MDAKVVSTRTTDPRKMMKVNNFLFLFVIVNIIPRFNFSTIMYDETNICIEGEKY